jgi:rubrerythrin
MDGPEKMECGLCGYTASGKFLGFICPQSNLTYYRCSKCGYKISAAMPPDDCPSCNEMRIFKYHVLYAGLRGARKY